MSEHHKPLFRDWAPPPLDVCRGRNQGSETSAAAHAKAKKTRAVYERILSLVRSKAGDGCTLHELSAALEVAPHALSPRLTELRVGGFLTYALDDTGNKRKRRGAAVLVVKEVQR